MVTFSLLSQGVHEATDADYPFKAIIGGARYHLGCGTRTANSERIGRLVSKGEAEIALDDGIKLGIESGDSVRISSSYGSIERKVNLVRDLKRNSIFIPRGFKENDVRNLIPLAPLEAKHSPGFKEVYVKIDRS